MRRGRFHGLRFQRRIRVLPGVHVNLSLSGIGVRQSALRKQISATQSSSTPRRHFARSQLNQNVRLWLRDLP
jgi:hypothetical protein